MFTFLKKHTKTQGEALQKGLSKASPCARGFSLVELIMVVAIFIIISAIILSKQSKFSSDILISNVAYEIALSLREAQVYGIGAKQGTSLEKLGYGIHIEALSGSKPTSMTFFGDKNFGGYNYVYDKDTDILLEDIALPQGQKIMNFCGKNGSVWVCSSDNTDPLPSINITFLKPNPEPFIRSNEGVEEYSDAKIVVESSLGDKCRTILVTNTGQITVEAITNGGVCP